MSPDHGCADPGQRVPCRRNRGRHVAEASSDHGNRRGRRRGTNGRRGSASASSPSYLRPSWDRPDRREGLPASPRGRVGTGDRGRVRLPFATKAIAAPMLSSAGSWRNGSRCATNGDMFPPPPSPLSYSQRLCRIVRDGFGYVEHLVRGSPASRTTSAWRYRVPRR